MVLVQFAASIAVEDKMVSSLHLHSKAAFDSEFIQYICLTVEVSVLLNFLYETPMSNIRFVSLL